MRSVTAPVVLLVLVWLIMGLPFISFAKEFVPNTPEVVHSAKIIDGRTHRVIRKAFTYTNPSVSYDSQDISLMAIGAIVLVALNVALISWTGSAYKYNSSVFPQQLHRWRSGFLCKGCGALFYPPDVHTIVQSR